MACRESNGHVTDDVSQVNTQMRLETSISKTAGDAI